MDRVHYIGLDGHSRTCDLASITATGRKSGRWHVPTSIKALAEVLEQIPRPRYLTLEEGPMADWFLRQLRPFVDEILVCDPRRNALIGRDGDKTDAVDALALAELYRGGYLRAVHHSATQEREVFKRHVSLYHDRVEHRVAECNKVLAFLRRFGMVLCERDLAPGQGREAWLAQVPPDRMLRLDVDLLLEAYDAAMAQTKTARRLLVEQAKKHDEIVRFTSLPGVKWVRAATLFVYLDTPHRFRSKRALWKYLGIGLQRSTSGAGPVVVKASKAFNRRLKYAIIGAVMSAVRTGDNPFARQHRRLIHEQGLSPRVARRTVARSMASVLWGMWKSGGAYQPERVGVQSGQRARPS